MMCLFSAFSFAAEDLKKIEDMIRLINPSEVGLASTIKTAAERSGIPSEVLIAKFTNESGLGRKLDNKLGYVGIGQMGAEAYETGLKEMGISNAKAKANDLNNRTNNKKEGIIAAAGLLKHHLKNSNGKMGVAISKYGAGAGSYNDMIKNGGKGLTDTRKQEMADDLYRMNLRANILKKFKSGQPLTNEEKKLLTSGIAHVPKSSYYNSLDSLNKGIKGNVPTNGSNFEEGFDTNIKTANYRATIELDWDSIVAQMGEFIEEGLSKIKTISIVLMSLAFCIQLSWDMFLASAGSEIKAIITTIIRRTLNFTFYLFIGNQIANGSILKMCEDIAYGLIQAILGESGVHKISSLWTINEKMTSVIWEQMAKLWGWSSVLPSEFGRDFILTLIYLIMILVISIAIFIMMGNLFKLFISFQLVLGLSNILLFLGLIDYSKGFYSISKVMSLCLNFIVKLAYINIIVVIIMKMFTNSNLFYFDNVGSITDILSSQMLISIVLTYVIYYMFTKIEISF